MPKATKSTSPAEFKELNLLKVFAKREILEKYKPLLKKHTVLPETWLLLEDYGKYFSQYPDRDEIDFSLFGVWFASAHSSYKDDKLGFFKTVLGNVSTASEDACNDLLQHFARLDVAIRVRDTADRYINGSVPSLEAALRVILDEHSQAEREFSDDVENEAGLFVPTSAEHLVEALTSGSAGYRWSLKLLNEAFGPMHLGDFGAVMARPNGGKTTLLIQECLNFLLQMDEEAKCLIFNNEEKGEKLTAYAYKNLLKQPLTKIALAPAKSTKDFEAKLGGRKFYVKDDAGMTPWHAERIIEKVRPKIIGFNLLCKLHGYRKDTSELEALIKLFRWAREIGKRYNCIVLTCHQADTSAEGEKYMTQQQMYGSKTEIQGELDVLLSVGRSHDVASANTRYLSSAKNKQPDSPGMDPLKREGPLGEVGFDGDTATFYDK